MTLDLAKLRAETLALIDGTTPGPWWTDATDTARINGGDGRSVGAAHRCGRFIGPDPVQAGNARLIAAAPKLAADNLRLMDEIERLRDVLSRIAVQKRSDELETALAVEYADFQDGYDIMIDEARAALAKENPDDR